MNADVTIVSCVYGDRGYERFTGRWEAAIAELETRPLESIVLCDSNYPIRSAHVFVDDCPWRHAQAYYLQRAVELAMTEWVWILDIDDVALPDALFGIDSILADVWLFGYERSDGLEHVPPALTNDEYLASVRNEYAACSAFRRDAFIRAGGFPDVAFQDWALWRRLAASGATFEASDRAHYRYMRHPITRGAIELTTERRSEHMAEMEAALVP